MTSTTPRKPVLMVLTSHGSKGATGEPTGIPFELASIQGGEPPVDGRLVTGQNPQSAAGVGAAMRELLLGRG